MDSDTLSTLVDLLKQPSPKSSTTQNTTESSLGTSASEQSEKKESKPTIFDLAQSDRYRILKLIEELLDSQEEADQLKQRLEDQKSEFREKRSSLMKKIDLLSEKHEKALMDIQRLKETHLESLTSLEEKITLVSQKFEESVEEVEKLKKANADLHKENLDLLKLNFEVSSTVANMKEENSKLRLELKESRHREKSANRKLKKLSSVQVNESFRSPNDHNHSSLSFPEFSEQSILSAEDLNININRLLSRHRHVGSGDCDFVTRQNLPAPSALGITTIKAPSTAKSEQNGKSEKLELTGSVNTSEIPSASSNLQNVDPLDAAIIENLFFRF